MCFKNSEILKASHLEKGIIYSYPHKFGFDGLSTSQNVSSGKFLETVLLQY